MKKITKKTKVKVRIDHHSYIGHIIGKGGKGSLHEYLYEGAGGRHSGLGEGYIPFEGEVIDPQENHYYLNSSSILEILQENTMNEFLQVGNIVKLKDGAFCIIMPSPHGGHNVAVYKDGSCSNTAIRKDSIEEIYKLTIGSSYYSFFGDNSMLFSNVNLVWRNIEDNSEEIAKIQETIEEAQATLNKATAQLQKLEEK